MEYFPCNLYEVIRYYRKKQMDFPNFLGKVYSYQLFRAIAYLDNLSISHRDIKPQNILIELKNHKLVLCDFGSAKMISKESRSIAYICSRFYRAPELILGFESYTTSVDIWSVGCVIGEMFLGEPMFKGNDNKTQMIEIMKLLGTPSDEEVKIMTGNNEKIFKFSEYEKVDFKIFLGGTDVVLIDLLEKVLVYDYEKRMKPIDALLHPYFDELRESKLTINGKDLVDFFDFGEEELGKDYQFMLRDLVPGWWRKFRISGLDN